MLLLTILCLANGAARSVFMRILKNCVDAAILCLWTDLSYCSITWSSVKEEGGSVLTCRECHLRGLIKCYFSVRRGQMLLWRVRQRGQMALVSAKCYSIRGRVERINATTAGAAVED